MVMSHTRRLDSGRARRFRPEAASHIITRVPSGLRDSSAEPGPRAGPGPRGPRSVALETQRGAARSAHLLAIAIQVQLLLLTSQCWDAALCARLRTKLLAQLPEGALVVDYTAAVGGKGAGGEAETDGGAGGVGRRFVLLEKVHAPVSWDAGHVFWVWRCESLSSHRTSGQHAKTQAEG